MKKIRFTSEQIALTAILFLSAILNFSNLSVQEYANQYYSAGVKSMLKSFSNFFFVSFDPEGFITIDKPPVGFWMQAISAKIFGFNSFGILFPQALAGVISVGILYYLIKRYFGVIPGLISALCLAITPIFVATSKNNTIDNQLILVLLIAAIFLFKALDTGKRAPLLLSLLFVGIGFNIKMLQAYFILPAIYLTYFIAAKTSLKKRIMDLSFGFVVLILVSLSWAIVVDLVPAENRPYVGSSSNNSELELIIGHNGIERFSRDTGGGGQNGPMASDDSSIDSSDMTDLQGTQDNASDMMSGGMPGNQQDEMNQGPSGGGGSGFGQTEQDGLARLFSNGDLSDQISWMLPFALLGFLAALLKEKLNLLKKCGAPASIIFWFTFLLPEFLYFSFTQGLFHPYYLTMLSAPIAALVGIGIKYMWEYYKENTLKSFLLPLSFMITGAVQMLLLSYFYDISDISKILTAFVILFCMVSAVILFIYKIYRIKCIGEVTKSSNRFTISFTTLALLGLFISPAVWSSTTVFYQMSGTFPSAGLDLIPTQGQSSSSPMQGGFGTDNTDQLIEFLQENKTDEKYILVTLSAAGTASSIILETDEAVMALGGFEGQDPTLTLDEFKELVKNGDVRYIMVEGMRGDSQGDEDSDSVSAIMSWAMENGTLVDQSEWSDSTDSTSSENENDNMASDSMEHNSSLYDLKGSVTD